MGAIPSATESRMTVTRAVESVRAWLWATTKLAVAFVLVASLVSGCATRPLSVQQEKQLGTIEQQRVKQQFPLLRDRIVVGYVRKLGRELARSSPPSPFDLRFYVVEDPELNAFAIPGGAIYINTGLIMKASDVSELAGVLAHEIGHVTERHAAFTYARSQRTGFIARFLALVIAVGTGNPNAADGGALLSALGAQAYMGTYARDQERESDAVAVKTLIKAGYDPDGLIRFFETLQASNSGANLPQFLSTHPATPERIENARDQIASRELPRELRSSDDGLLEDIQARIRIIQEGSVGL